jgi:hypothetical protein
MLQHNQGCRRGLQTFSAVTKNERPEEAPQERRSDVALNRLRLNPLKCWPVPLGIGPIVEVFFAIILKAREREARTRTHVSYKASYHPATARLLRSGRAQSKFSRSGHARSHGTGTRSLSRHSPEPTAASAFVSHTKAQAVANI